tara:strand:- start:130 stop:249 length:120 start_codon:yes stop_codon:yes gene_type:complete
MKKGYKYLFGSVGGLNGSSPFHYRRPYQEKQAHQDAYRS